MRRWNKRAYLVLDGVELFRAQFLEVLWNVLVWKVTAQEDSVNQTIRTSDLRQGACILAFFDHLEQPLKIESRRRTAHNALTAQVEGPGV